jgi:hypothetical protein
VAAATHAAGRTISVNRVEDTRPPTITTASGFSISAPTAWVQDGSVDALHSARPAGRAGLNKPSGRAEVNLAADGPVDGG